MGDDSTAIKYFTKAINVFGRDLFFLKNRIKAYSRLNMYEEVVKDCSRALALDITDPQTICEIYSFRGSAYYNLNRSDLALADFKIANEKFPHYHYPYVMLSYMALISNRIEEASEIIDHGIEQCDRTYGLHALYSFRVSYLSKNDQQYRKRLKAMDGDVLARIS
jgi:tetratricopeptide (TPR) repeat protein